MKMRSTELHINKERPGIPKWLREKLNAEGRGMP
jgi:hypothetical protein